MSCCKKGYTNIFSFDLRGNIWENANPQLPWVIFGEMFVWFTSVSKGSFVFTQVLGNGVWVNSCEKLSVC